MADTSLIFSIIARDKTTSVLNRISNRANATGSVIAKALAGPAVVPALAATTVGIMSMGVALASAGAGAGVFGAVMKSAQTEISESATKFQDLQDKMDLYGKQAEVLAARGEDNSAMLKKQANAALELEARLGMLPPAQRAATEGYMGMKSNWDKFVESNKPATYGILARGYTLMSAAISKMQPFFDAGRNAVDRLMTSLERSVAGGFIERMAARSGPALNTLTGIIINTSKALARMFGRVGGGQGQSMLVWIETMTAKWAEWAGKTDGTGFDRFLNYAQQHGPAAVQTFKDLATAALHIAQAVTPLAPISLAIASALASIVAAIPSSWLTAIVAGFIAFNVAMRLYALGSAIATAAQWAMNTALLASPITWIVLAIVALVAIIVLVATKTRFFQTIWAAVWGFMKGVGAWFAGPFANFFVSMWQRIVNSLNRARAQFMTVVNFVKNLFLGWVRVQVSVATKIISAFGRVVSFFRSAPGRIRGAISGMFNGLWTGFRNVVNRIIGGWNRLSFGIPGFSFAGISVPGISVGTPDLPYLARGGHVQQEGLAYIHKGETVTPSAKVTPYRSAGDGRGATLTIKSDGSRLSNLLLEVLREAIRDRGGDPVKVLTAR